MTIISLKSKGQTTEVKCLTKDTPAQGKSVNLDKFFDLKEDSITSNFCILGRSNAIYRSFTFFPLELLDILLSLENEELSATDTLRH